MSEEDKETKGRPPITGHKPWGIDKETHHLLLLKEPPAELIELRNTLQLPANIDICQYAMGGATFEECMGRIAERLDIALDGWYNPVKLCKLLNTALENRMLHKNKPHMRAEGLVDIELHETEDEVKVVKRDRDKDGEWI